MWKNSLCHDYIYNTDIIFNKYECLYNDQLQQYFPVKNSIVYTFFTFWIWRFDVSILYLGERERKREITSAGSRVFFIFLLNGLVQLTANLMLCKITSCDDCVRKSRPWFSRYFDVGENLISRFVDNYNDKILVICNEIQKEEERQCSFSAMGYGLFDCEIDRTRWKYHVHV